MADPAERLAGLLLEGLEHLRRGRAPEAIAPLQEVCAAPELAHADDLADVRARAHSLLAQALLQVDRPLEASEQLQLALELSSTDPDPAGRKALFELQSQIGAAVSSHREHAERTARLAALSVEQIEDRVRDPTHLIDVLIRKVNAEIDSDRPGAALALAQRVLSDAITLGDPRLEVLTRLSIARADPGRAMIELQRALARADRANEPNLVTAIVRSAELHGITPEALEGDTSGGQG